MDNKDNRIGLGLALSSSAFIGLSFIVKKKGLIRSRSSGSSAGDGSFAYLREWLWWAGLLTMVVGEAANFIAYAFAPAILVTPLGALSVIISAILASWLLKERLLLLGKVGCALCIIGSTVIVLNAPEEKQVSSVSEITDQMFTNGPFLGYAVCVILLSVYLIFVVAPKHGKRNIFVNLTICSVVGSLSVIGVKGLGIALKLTIQGSNQLGKGSTWGFLVMVVICIMTQMNYLNKALDTFNTAVVTPIYYVLFTTCTIIASALLFRGWSQTSGDVEAQVCAAETATARLITCFCGFLTICGGVFLLHKSREDATAGTTQEDDVVQLISQRSVSDSLMEVVLEEDEHSL